ncbi:hypothetical protein [Pseudomonas sp. NPDC089401]|uniref:hypothetical protein n=1 Tax=Pseudomonas sp. NPDC089401 TaxID=3364462 RepID=UPI003812EE93
MPNPAPFDLNHAVAAQFASRPTLRQVAGAQVMKVITGHYPLLAVHRPGLTCAEPLLLMSRQADGSLRNQPLVDVVLQAMLEPEPLVFSVDDHLSLAPPRRLYAIEDRFETAEGDRIEPAPLTDAINALLPMLPWHFQQAQIDYWNGNGELDRDLWLQQVLRASLLDGLADQTLDDEQRGVLRDLLMGYGEGIEVQVVEVTLRTGEGSHDERLPGLLVMAGNEVRQLTLWCSPDGLVRGFDSPGAFGIALQLQMARRYQFEALHWRGLQIEGETFALYSSMLLEILLARCARLRWSSIDTIAQLDALYHQATDPAVFFAERSAAWPTAPGLALPGGLRRAAKDDQSAYLQAMIDLSLLQQRGPDVDQPDTVPSLQAYAARRLREQMLADHPVDANYFPDDLILTVDTFVGDGHGLGFGQKIGSKTMSLTALAIGRLNATAEGIVTHVAHREGQLIMQWMTVDYINDLVARVDIGASYPIHVRSIIDDPLGRDARVATFARHWRIALLFDAARARVVKRLDRPTYDVLARFCRAGRHGAAGIRIAPLAFKRSPTSRLIDRAHGFYVIEVIETGALLLYCPLYSNSALLQYQDMQALRAAIGAAGELQDRVLTWLEQGQRAVYDHGGFNEPHLPHWLPDPYTPVEKPEPVRVLLQFWSEDVDRQLFEAKGRMLIELADRSTLSNSALRWQLVSVFAWTLLNVAMPLVSGPLASVAWLYTGIRSLVEDVQGLVSEHAGERALAMVDVLNNTLMGLIHLQTPRLAARPALQRLPPARLAGPPAAKGIEVSSLPAPTQGASVPVGSLQAAASAHLDFSWRGAGGLNGFSARQRSSLRALAANVSLQGRLPQAEGEAAGLVMIEGSGYLGLDGGVYQVGFAQGEAFIVGPDGSAGPRLLRDGSTWRVDTRLRGGSGRSAAVQARLRKKLTGPIDKALAEIARYIEAGKNAVTDFQLLTGKMHDARDAMDKVGARLGMSPPADPQQLAQFQQANALFTLKYQQLAEQMLTLRQQALDKVEGVFSHYVEAERTTIALLDNRICRPSNELTAGARETLIDVRRNLLVYGQYIYDERLALGGFQKYDELTQALNGAGVEHRAAIYQAYRALLEKMVQEQPAIIKVSSELDRLLAVTDIDMQLPYGTSTRSVAQIIASRSTTTVSIRFFQAMHLIELSLQPHGKATVQHYMIFREALSGRRLRVAAQAHHLLMYSDLPVAQRIEVLQSAWDEYLAAILNGERIKAFGGDLIDIPRLESYRQQMIELKTMAGESLVQAMREQAKGEVRGSQRAVYPPRSLQVAHTRAGQIVLGSEVTVDGQPELQVLGTFSREVVHRFHKADGAWVETVASLDLGTGSQALPPESMAGNREVAESMLAQNPRVIAQARALVARDSDDRGLASMLDGQINEMAELRGQFADARQAGELVERLDQALLQLRQVRRDCLVELFTRTAYPSARGLAFLHQQGLLEVDYLGPRHAVSDGYLDEYRVKLLQAPGDLNGKPLWAAHFHFADSQAAPTAFGKGHLKLWKQRKQGYREQMTAADEGQVLYIYRGNLTYAQAKDIIPFNSY